MFSSQVGGGALIETPGSRCAVKVLKIVAGNDGRHSVSALGCAEMVKYTAKG